MKIRVGARSSPLSRAQVAEVLGALHGVEFEMKWVETTGDKDRTTSLRGLDKSDFFTRELDEMLLSGEIQAAIHSAKDLPEPLPNGLRIAAITTGVDSRDSLVMREGESLRSGFLVATSSERREEAVRAVCKDVRFVDIRGTIQERLEKLWRREVDGVVVAEAALIRLRLGLLHRVILPGKAAPLQGRLAIVTREGDAIESVFASLRRHNILYLGLDSTRFGPQGTLIHYPVIRTALIDGPELKQACALWPQCTHVIFTSKTAVALWDQDLTGKIVSAIGEATASTLRARGVKPLVAPQATQEGVIELLKTLPLEHAYLFLPCSKKSRDCLVNFLQNNQIKHHAFALYDTLLQKPEPVPDLADIDEIVFTSPSTVDGFLQIFGALPREIKLTPIGPVTRLSLLNSESL